MGIDRLQKGGNSFRMSYGAGNFTRQFNKETRHGELQNLSDNRKTILKVIDKYKTYIRRNILGRKLQKKAYSEIKKEEGNKLTIGDKRDIKKILKHFSEKTTAKEEPKIVPFINRAKAEDPSNLAPDSMVKKIGGRFTINQNFQNGKTDNNIQIQSRSLNMQTVAPRNEELFKPTQTVAPRNEELINPVLSINQNSNINQNSFQVQEKESFVNSGLNNIEKKEAPVNLHALGLARREKNPHPLSEMIQERQNNTSVNLEKLESEADVSKVQEEVQKETELVKPNPVVAEKSVPIDVKMRDDLPKFESVNNHIVKAQSNLEINDQTNSGTRVLEEKEPINLHALGLAKRVKSPHSLSEMIKEKSINAASLDIKKNNVVKKVQADLSDTQKKINIQGSRNIQRNEADLVSTHGSGIAGVKGPREADITPFEGQSAASRGQAARAQINYQHATKLGGSETARKIQKDSFEKMNNINNSLAA